MEIGYKLMAEAFDPVDLVEQAVRAEGAGFDFVEISDHFHPWLETQGHSPFAWSVLGAVAARTERVRLLTGVTCPTVRYHPAIIAQAAATLGVLSRGRFTLGVGSGERLNEHIVGEGFPESPRKRQEMLREAVEIIRLLWEGGYRSHKGEYFEVARARIFDLPTEPVPIAVAAGGPKAARLAAEIGDAMFLTEPDQDLIRAYTQAGGSGPRYGEMMISYARDEQTAAKAARETTRWSVLGWKVMSELPTPEAFAAASETVRTEDIMKAFPCGPDPDKIAAAARAYVEAGTDHLVVVNCGPDPDAFFDFYTDQLDGRLRALPSLP
ncbi:TIGR03557 family F420-dependent LLM class oxidoreductase [Actinocorallia sp. API 0066]|uniref:TIGR03557 family F420-dependent LLM class oxidoreductase n=1 Tax=Actinocorallia sp. API 0066 TaxID=2896846 RepID=UPI001E43B892|nr:TIGR03557 family F420-dependent LLM class oxidoreductase [Actinocorallia sp. API 0066]MCD0448885.1 TIGR03557 family F420-dependent LLM class oxidoreductase [Actinocorallia sp. API 0066]